MSAAILNQPWEDVADDVTGAIEKAVQPLLKTAVDSIYSGLLDATQDYLRDNLAFNIASRIHTAEREAADNRRALSGVLEALDMALKQFSEPMSALNGHELGDRLDGDVREIVEHARNRYGLARARGDDA